ncbi:MAG: hypothetical protein ABH843_05165 [Candidatus Omnitrophota bacterium]
MKNIITLFLVGMAIFYIAGCNFSCGKSNEIFLKELKANRDKMMKAQASIVEQEKEDNKKWIELVGKNPYSLPEPFLEEIWQLRSDMIGVTNSYCFSYIEYINFLEKELAKRTSGAFTPLPRL